MERAPDFAPEPPELVEGRRGTRRAALIAVAESTDQNNRCVGNKEHVVGL
jgi:hypothetical protein